VRQVKVRSKVKQPKSIRYSLTGEGDLDYLLIDRKSVPKREPDVKTQRHNSYYGMSLWLHPEWVGRYDATHTTGTIHHLMVCPRTQLLMVAHSEDDGYASKGDTTKWNYVLKPHQDAYLEWKTTQEFEEIVLGVKDDAD